MRRSLKGPAAAKRTGSTATVFLLSPKLSWMQYHGLGTACLGNSSSCTGRESCWCLQAVAYIFSIRHNRTAMSGMPCFGSSPWMLLWWLQECARHRQGVSWISPAGHIMLPLPSSFGCFGDAVLTVVSFACTCHDFEWLQRTSRPKQNQLVATRALHEDMPSMH